MTIPFFRMHIINHPLYLEHIQKHNSKNYIRGNFIRNVFGPLHRAGIFIVDGEEWQFQRKAATRAFSKRNFENHITKSLHYWLDILVGLLSNLAEADKEFDFQELMGRLMFCLFLQVAFHEDQLGRDVLSEDPECLKSMPDYIRAFDQAATCMLCRFLYLTFCRGSDTILLKALIVEGVTHYGDLAKSYPVKTRSPSKLPTFSTKRSMVSYIDVLMQSNGDISLTQMMELSSWTSSNNQQTTLTNWAGWFSRFCQLDVSHEYAKTCTYPSNMLMHAGDTTAFSLSWLMKEIHHSDNAHLDAANKIRAEAASLDLSSDYLAYGDVPVC
jgi:hypothetical protein